MLMILAITATSLTSCRDNRNPYHNVVYNAQGEEMVKVQDYDENGNLLTYFIAASMFNRLYSSGGYGAVNRYYYGNRSNLDRNYNTYNRNYSFDEQPRYRQTSPVNSTSSNNTYRKSNPSSYRTSSPAVTTSKPSSYKNTSSYRSSSPATTTKSKYRSSSPSSYRSSSPSSSSYRSSSPSSSSYKSSSSSSFRSSSPSSSSSSRSSSYRSSSHR